MDLIYRQIVFSSKTIEEETISVSIVKILRNIITKWIFLLVGFESKREKSYMIGRKKWCIHRTFIFPFSDRATVTSITSVQRYRDIEIVLSSRRITLRTSNWFHFSFVVWNRAIETISRRSTCLSPIYPTLPPFLFLIEKRFSVSRDRAPSRRIPIGLLMPLRPQ